MKTIPQAISDNNHQGALLLRYNLLRCFLHYGQETDCHMAHPDSNFG